MNWSAIAALALALAVGFGAFGAHTLKSRLDSYEMGVWEKAVFYHFIHALGMLITPLLIGKSASTVCWLLLAGIVLFSGSLYALALSGVRGWGAVTPLGGTAFLAGWVLLAYRLARLNR